MVFFYLYGILVKIDKSIHGETMKISNIKISEIIDSYLMRGRCHKIRGSNHLKYIEICMSSIY